MQIGPLVIPYNDQGVVTSRKEMKNGKRPAGVSGMWCLHGATFGTVWERCTESPASSTSEQTAETMASQAGDARGWGKAWMSGWKTSCVSSISRISRNV